MKAIRALLLVLTLSACAYAGDMDNGRTGEIPCGRTGEMDNGKMRLTDPIMDTALQILQSMSLLF